MGIGEALASLVIPLVTQGTKKISGTRWAPILALAMGIGYEFLAALVTGAGPQISTLLDGSQVGGVSVLLYSLVKHSLGGKVTG